MNQDDVNDACSCAGSADGASSCTDQCGKCTTDNPDNNTTANCDGGTNWNSNQSKCTVMDCAGTCNGNAFVYAAYADSDGDGLGDSCSANSYV